MLIHIKGSSENGCKCTEAAKVIKSYEDGMYLYACQKCGLRFFSLKPIEEKKKEEKAEDSYLNGIW